MGSKGLNQDTTYERVGARQIDNHEFEDGESAPMRHRPCALRSCGKRTRH